MDKRLVLLVLIAACLFVGASAGVASQAETEPVTVGVPRDFYPEYAIDAEDRPEGFGVDVMNAVAKRAGLSVTYRVFPTWSETLAALERGDIDVIPVVVITPARESRLLFTRPFLTSRMSIFVRRDAENIQGVADLAGRRMGVIKGGPVPELFGEEERRPVIVPYGRLQDEMFGLLLGEVDAIPPFEDSAWKVAERAGVADRLKVVGEPYTEAKRAMAVRRDLPGLRDRLDAAVADLLNSPEYSSIYAAWHAEPPSFWTTTRATWIAGASVSLLVLGMLLWQSLSLRASEQLAEGAPRKLPGERVPAAFQTLCCFARMRADSARARPCCPDRLDVRRGRAQDRVAGADCHAALDGDNHSARRWSSARNHRAGADRGYHFYRSGRRGLAHRSASAAATCDGARLRHRSVVVSDRRQQSAGPRVPRPTR